MTVCIAAKCKDGTEPVIFCLSDRMVTAGDIQFQPPAPKVILLTSSIAAMTSDEDAALHAEILQDLSQDISARVAKASDQWLDVEFAAELYLKHRNEAKRRRAERDILFPLGLTTDSFIAQQHSMADLFIRQVSADLVNYPLPSMSVIFCGVDTKGSHIYLVHDNDLGCYDAIGFASIGIGARHANSQFMFQGHTPASPMAETLLLAYMAKKRAEVAPGVGTETDIFFFGSRLGSFSGGLHEELTKKLEREYDKISEQEKRQLAELKLEVSKHVERVRDEARAALAAGQSQETPKPTR